MKDAPGQAEGGVRRAQRLDGVEVSEIVRIAESARARRARGEDIIALGTGEPDFATPEHVKRAAEAAMAADDTHYTPTAGTAALREAVSAKLARDNGLDYRPAEVIVSTGAKQVLFNAFMATLDPGDEVIVPTPYWTSYADMLRIAGARPVLVPCSREQGFRLTPEALEDALTPRTRWLLLNSPCNPTGAAYDRARLEALGAVLERHPRVWLVADEIYEHLVYGGFGFVSAGAALPGLRERTLIVNGVSKAYAMTGWRIGYGAAPEALIRAMTAVQGQVTSGASSISQAAAVAALEGPQDAVEQMRLAFERRRDLVVSALNDCPGLACLEPEGAFYAFPSCEGLLGRTTPDGKRLEDDGDVCEYLLETAGVAVVPGRAFGGPGHFRLSYAYAEDALQEACGRIRRACDALESA